MDRALLHPDREVDSRVTYWRKEIHMAYQNVLRSVRERHLLYRVGDFRGKVVVDLGCAEGLDAVAVKNAGAAMVYGVDPCQESKRADGLEFVQADANSIQPIPCDVLIVNSVARWIGPEGVLRWIIESSPSAVYLETHSEEDEWSWDVIRKSGYLGWSFEEIGRLPYLLSDPRPIRIFMRGVVRRNIVIKAFPPSRQLQLGVEFAVLKSLRAAGIRVPIAVPVNQFSLGVVVIPSAVHIRDCDPQFDIPELRRVLTASWLVGDCDVRDAGGSLVRYGRDIPCRGERHDGNLLWDGEKLWAIDYGLAFSHLQWILNPASHLLQDFSSVIPEAGLSERFLPAFRKAVSMGLDPGVTISLEENPWLSAKQTEIANQIVEARRIQ